MRHFGFLDEDDRERLFLHPPAPFGPHPGAGSEADVDLLGVGLGATLYCPATRPRLADDIRRLARRGVTSVVVCLEDSVRDDDLADAELNAVRQLRDLDPTTEPVPMVFVRIRTPDQIPMILRGLGGAAAMLTGFVVPKFTEDSGAAHLDAVISGSDAVGRRLLVMPVFEAHEIGHVETRGPALLAARRLLDKYRAHVPAVRVGATDLSGAYGLRRPREFTVWDVRVVADALAAVVNVFGRAEPDRYVIAGPVWEYFSTPERMFKPQLRETPFADYKERALRATLLAADLDGLLREVALDRANGFTGKTVIHPSHIAPVHALSVVAHEEYADACDVLATESRGGAVASSFGNKMNESKPHTAWATRVLQRASVFGVAREGVTFVDLLAASLHS